MSKILFNSFLGSSVRVAPRGRKRRADDFAQMRGAAPERIHRAPRRRSPALCDNIR